MKIKQQKKITAKKIKMNQFCMKRFFEYENNYFFYTLTPNKINKKEHKNYREK